MFLTENGNFCRWYMVSPNDRRYRYGSPSPLTVSIFAPTHLSFFQVSAYFGYTSSSDTTRHLLDIVLEDTDLIQGHGSATFEVSSISLSDTRRNVRLEKVVLTL